MANTQVAFEGWGASGVAWGDQPWGQGTGSNIEATGETGSVVVNAVAVVGVTGEAVLANVGDETVIAGANIVVTSVFASGETGSVLVETDSILSVTGLEATGETGTATVSANSVSFVSGSEATILEGSVTTEAGASIDVSGEELSSFVGTVSVKLSQRILVNKVSAVTALGNEVIAADANVSCVGVSGQGVVGYYLIWSLIDTNQNPSWSQISNTQSANWTQIAA